MRKLRNFIYFGGTGIVVFLGMYKLVASLIRGHTNVLFLILAIITFIVLSHFHHEKLWLEPTS